MELENPYYNTSPRDTYYDKERRLYRSYLYGAYGSNLNIEQMMYRCPHAEAVGSMVLQNHALVFRAVADIEYCKGSTVEIGLWKITRGCEDRLDIYEGFPSFYKKKLESDPTLADYDAKAVMLYFMGDRKWVSPPSDGYLQSVAQGYRDFNLDDACLIDALKRSYLDETPVPKRKIKLETRSEKIKRLQKQFKLDY